MATTASPYGMVPVNLIGGRVFAGSTRMLPIASNYATSIFFGDVVKCVNDGTIAKDTGTATLTPIGIFMGVTYMDATYGPTFRQMYTANTVPPNSTLSIAYICDDPYAVFKIQGSAAMTQTMLFNNAGVVQGAGVTTSGNSGVTLDVSTVATTNTLPLRIIGWAGNNVTPGTAAGVAQECLAPGDTYPDVLVSWNAGMHAYQNATGV